MTEPLPNEVRKTLANEPQRCPRCGSRIERIRINNGRYVTVIAGLYEGVWYDGKYTYGQVDHKRNCGSLAEIRRRKGKIV